MRSPGWPHAVAWIRHDIPTRLTAGEVLGVQVEIENRGSEAWLRHHPDGHRVDLVVLWDGSVAATHGLPRAEVKPSESVTVHFALAAPGEGRHRLALDLVQQGVAFFADRAGPRTEIDVQVDMGPATPSAGLAERAARVSPWHYQPTRSISQARGGGRYPRFATRGVGCRLWDADGREFVDYVMGWGCSLLGYAEPRVQAAVREAMGSAPLLTLTHPLEIEVAGLLTQRFPGAEMVVFGKHGSDACTLAARVARAFTSRRVILYSGYHGWQDFWAEQVGFASSGIPDRPEALIHGFRFNDEESFRTLFDRHRHDLAAVMLEPAGPIAAEGEAPQDADPRFLGLLAEATRTAGALLVFDEILTGFRYPGGSVQQAVGIVPDLTCLGKGLGAGYPLSALVGRRAVLQGAMGRTHYGPTFRGEVYSLAASRAALDIYATEPVADHVRQHGERLRAALGLACRQAGVDASCAGPPFRMLMHFRDLDPERRALKTALFHQEMLKGGVLTYQGFLLPSYAHDEYALGLATAAAHQALDRIGAAERAGRLHHELELPPA